MNTKLDLNAVSAVLGFNLHMARRWGCGALALAVLALGSAQARAEGAGSNDLDSAALKVKKQERISEIAVNSQGVNQAKALERRGGVIRLVGEGEAGSGAKASESRGGGGGGGGGGGDREGGVTNGSMKASFAWGAMQERRPEN